MKTSSARSLTLVSGVVCASLSVLRGVEGQATRNTQYQDATCEVDSGLVTVSFGVGSFEEPYTLNAFNECIPGDMSSTITVCNVDNNGEAGMNFYSDETCGTVSAEMAEVPTCKETVPGAECTGSYPCASITECTNDEPSAITPNSYNIRAIEYKDAECTTPTGADGDTVVLASDALGSVVADGTCAELIEGLGHYLSQCNDDGSVLTQSFSPDDHTCEGDVWSETSSPSDMSAVCATVEIDGLYYSYVSCTMDAVTVGGTTDATTTAPTDLGNDTPSPSTSTGSGDSGIEVTMAPTEFGATMMPTAASDRSIVDSEEDGEEGVDGANGASSGAGNGFSAVATLALSCAAGLLTFIAA